MIIELGFLTIDVAWLIAFFSGILFGFLLMGIIYLYAVLRSLNKGLKRKDVTEADIDEQEIKWLISDAHKQFKDKTLQKEIGFGPHLYHVSLELAKDIAKKFYPKSKYPFLELSIDEALVLLKYVSDRFNELLERPILKLFKGITLRRLVSLKDAKDVYDKNLLVKTSQKLKVSHIVKNTLMALNVVNPVYWFRRLVLNNILSVIVVRLGLVIISLTGEETYKIYSKKVFDVEKELDSGIDDIYSELERTMKEAKVDEEESQEI